MSGVHAFMSPSFAHIAYKCAAAPLRTFQIKQRMELLREVAVEYYGVKKPLEVMRLEKILEEDTEFADEGTALHAIFEDAMNNPKMKKSDVVKAIKSHSDITEKTISDPFIHGQMYKIIEDERKFIKACDWFKLEPRIKVRGLPQFGHTDLVAGKIQNKVLYVKDLKTGYNHVHAKDNYQLMTYTTGILDEVDDSGESGWDKYKYVEITVIGLRWESSTVKLSTYELQKFKESVMYPAFIEAYSINPKATPGDHCLYCAGKIHCREWQHKFNMAMNEAFNDLDVDDLPTPELVELWKICKQAEKLMKQQLAPEIMQRFDGFDIPKGVKRISGNRIVKFKVSDAKVVAKLKPKVKNKGELYNHSLKTPKQIEAQLNLDDGVLDDITETTVNKPYLKL